MSKVQTHRSYSQKTFLNFVEMQNCAWYLWTCPSQSTGFDKFWTNWPRQFFWGKIDYSYFCQSNAPHHSKMLKLKTKPYRESSEIKFCKFDPNWDQIGGFSLLGQGIKRCPALIKNLLVLYPTTKKNPPDH